MQLLLMRTTMWKFCKISSPYNSPVFLWMKARYSSRMEQQATQQECQWTQLMLCSRTESFPGMGISHAPPLHRLNPLRLFSLGVPENKSVWNKAKNYRGYKTVNSRWSGRSSCRDAARGHELFQVPTWGMRVSKRKPYWGRYFQNINFETGIKQNGYSYAFHLWPINR